MTRRSTRRRSRWRQPLLRLLTRIAPPVVSAVLRLLSWTLRPRFINDQPLRAVLASGDAVIVAFWHNRLLMMPLVAPGQRFCIMVSQHRDGEIATRALAGWGIRTVRGSTTRGGVGGFLRLLDAFRCGYTLAVVPDGPRGPRYVAKPGVIRLAKATGAPIYPVTFAARRATRLRSWDRLIIPWPFTRVAIAVGEPLHVGREANAAELETDRLTLERRLTELARAAETALAD